MLVAVQQRGRLAPMLMAETPTTLRPMPELVPALDAAVLDSDTNLSQPTASGIDYDSERRRHPFFEEFFALLRYRNLVSQLVSRNIKTRYKRSVLGVAWTMIGPLMMMTVLTVVFSSLMGSSIPH